MDKFHAAGWRAGGVVGPSAHLVMIVVDQDLSQASCLHPSATHTSLTSRHLDAHLTVAASFVRQAKQARAHAGHRLRVDGAVLARQTEGL